MSNRFAVIMAGGRGERFWPLSRLSRPKHLLSIIGNQPMLARTVDRLEGLVPKENILVITNREQADVVAGVVASLPSGNIMAEPVGRDTAAAVGLAMVMVKRRNPDAVFAMLPADHVIHDQAGFQGVLGKAFEVAGRENALVTIGVRPTEPATGYGYIQRGRPLGMDCPAEVFEVQRFVEKPDLETAKAYLEDGSFFWNAGMFIWRVRAIDSALAEHAGELHGGLRNIENDLDQGIPLPEVLKTHYPALPRISIDYAVMEKARNVLVLQSGFDWDDVGSWPALARHLPADADGNVVRGNVLAEKSSNNIMVGEPGRLIAALGLEGFIVIQTPDATLICPRDQAQELKPLLRRLGENPDWSHLQ